MSFPALPTLQPIHWKLWIQWTCREHARDQNVTLAGSKEIEVLGRKSSTRIVFALARRARLGKLLHSIPAGARLVMGNLLAGWRSRKLDRDAMVAGVPFD